MNVYEGLDVGGPTSFRNTLYANGDATILGTATMSGNAAVAGNMTITGTLAVTGALTNNSTNLRTFLSGYRRPTLTFINVTTVDVENNTGTANQTTYVFSDGSVRSVTEDTSSTNKYRRFDITATANFTSGTEDSGLRSSLSEANNTWYAIYAVKSVIDAAKVVLVGDTTLPTQASFSTLNSAYGTDGWLFLGLIRNGDNSGTAGDILKFIQSGSMTVFGNTCVGNFKNSAGMRLATSASATSITWTYASGTGTAQIPGYLTIVQYTGFSGNDGTHNTDFTDSAAAITYSCSDNSRLWCGKWVIASLGGKITNGSASAMDIFIGGFIDPILGSGSNPLL